MVGHPAGGDGLVRDTEVSMVLRVTVELCKNHKH